MYRKRTPHQTLQRLAEQQAGVIALKQFEDMDFHTGAGRRWRQDWTRMLSGIYCLQEPTWTSWCWAALLHGGPSSVVGGSAAAHLLGAVKEPPEQILVWHGNSGAIRPIGCSDTGVTFRRAERSGRGEPPRTPIDVALMDLSDEGTEDETVAAVTRAFSQRLSTSTRLSSAMATRKRLKRRRLLTELCREASTGVESVLEWRFLQIVVRAHRLPDPTLQGELRRGTRSDAVWEDQGVVVELDGRLGHELAFRDMARDNRLAMSGLQTLRYGWHDVTHNPCQVAWQLSEVLQSRGWFGVRSRCERCRAARMG